LELETISEEPTPSDIHGDAEQDVSLSQAFGGRSIIRDILETVLLTVVIFVVVNALTGRFQVRGSSMEPTLHSGQYLIVSRLSYRLGDPQRGDVIVFEPPNGTQDDYIKRIIGLPGETVEARGGSIWIDGLQLEEPYVSGTAPYNGAWDLQDDEYFVLGDNRPNSSDSHSWGPLPRDNIVGKTWVCYWPPQYWGAVDHHAFQSVQDQE